MSATRRQAVTAPRPCANPICDREVEAGQAYAIELRQLQQDATTSVWIACGLTCARVFLGLSAVKLHAEAFPEASEAGR